MGKIIRFRGPLAGQNAAARSTPAAVEPYTRPTMTTKLDTVSRIEDPFRLGEWLVEPSLNRLSRGGAVIQVEFKAMDLLVYLARRAGDVVSRYELLDAVWQTEFVADNTLVKRIAQLREALGDDARKPRYIATIPKRGYCLIAELSFEDRAAAPSGLPEETLQSEAAERSPYPGLEPFTEADAADFFGRETEISLLWRKITSRRLLAVIGASGAGKSSLLRAGVVARAPPGWRAVVCQPGEDPFLAVARVLASDLAGDTEEIWRLLAFQDLEVALAVAARWRARWDEALLVVDQFEELFTLNPEPVRERFVELLRRLVDAAGIHVVLALRDDFLLACHRHHQLSPIFSDLTAVGPPVGDDLRRALVEPAARRLVGFESGSIVDDMVGQVERERGALPLLAFAALQLWELRDRDRRMLTREVYERIGGVAGALAQHAEATLEAIGPDRRSTVRELFSNLVTAEGTRAAREWNELLSVFSESQRESAESILRALVDARLVTSYELREGDGEPTTMVEIVHESLLRGWPRLVRWQAQDADGALLRDQLRQAAELWHARGRPAELLWNGAPYLEFRAWRESYPGGLTATEEAFSEAMVGHATRRRRRRRLAAAAVVLAALAVAAVTTALWRRSEDRSLRLEERRLVETAHQTMGRSPPEAFAYALAALELRDSPEARRLALAALWASPMPLVIDHWQGRLLSRAMTGADFSPDGRWLSVGQFDGQLALWPESGGSPIVWQPHTNRSRGYFAPDSTALITLSAGDPQLILWSVPDLRRLGSYETGTPLRTDIDARHANIACRLGRLVRDPAAPGGWRYDGRPQEQVEELADDRLPAVALSPDGSDMVYALGEELYLVSIADPAATPALLGRGPSAVDFIAYHPNGDGLATAHADGTARLWSLEDGVAEPLREWPRVYDSACNDLLFDPAGRLLVAGFDEGTASLRVLDGPPGSDPLRLAPQGSRTAELAFHPSGRWLATAGMRRVCLWPLERARLATVLRGHSGAVERLAFAPDGSWLASCGVDGTVRRWPLTASAGADTSILYDWGHRVERFVGWMTMAPDGRFLVTTGGDDSARLVPTNGTTPRVLGGFDERVMRAAVGPHGRQVAVPGYVGGKPVVRVWDLPSGAVTDIEFDAPPDDPIRFLIMDIELTSDGRLLAAHGGRLIAVDPATGRREALAEDVGQFAVGLEGRLILSRSSFDWAPCGVTAHDLAAATARPLASHGRDVSIVTLDPSGTVAVTASNDGIVRVGPVAGEAPHCLVGHEGRVMAVAVSPDGRWIASGGVDGTIRLWSMPDLAKPPLNALPRAELIARLRFLTNLRVVRDPDDREGYVVRADPFPGWQTTPTW